MTVAPGIAALYELCTTPDAPDRLRADPAGTLAAWGVSGEDAAAMLACGPERLLVYRTLVCNRLRNAVRGLLPRTVSRRGDAAFREEFGEFLARRGPRSPYLRDVPAEYLAWAGPRWADDPSLPAYLPELGAYELLDYQVANEPAGGEPHTGRPLALDRPLRVDGSATLRRFSWAFYRLPRNPADRTEPERKDTRLLVYRDRTSHKARYLELTPFGWALLKRIVERARPVEAALREACNELGEPLDDAHLAVAASLFADLEDRGVLLGAA